MEQDRKNPIHVSVRMQLQRESEMTATETTRPETEVERIERWRRQELERAGYPSDAAAEIAGRLDVDLHQAIQLLQRGCPADIATRILL